MDTKKIKELACEDHLRQTEEYQKEREKLEQASNKSNTLENLMVIIALYVLLPSMVIILAFYYYLSYKIEAEYGCSTIDPFILKDCLLEFTEKGEKQ